MKPVGSSHGSLLPPADVMYSDGTWTDLLDCIHLLRCLPSTVITGISNRRMLTWRKCEVDQNLAMFRKQKLKASQSPDGIKKKVSVFLANKTRHWVQIGQNLCVANIRGLHTKKKKSLGADEAFQLFSVFSEVRRRGLASVCANFSCSCSFKCSKRFKQKSQSFNGKHRVWLRQRFREERLRHSWLNAEMHHNWEFQNKMLWDKIDSADSYSSLKRSWLKITAHWYACPFRTWSLTKNFHFIFSDSSL